MIPITRPVIGRDLEEIKQLLGLSAGDTCYLLGLSITKWTSLVRTNPDEPVKDPTLALLVRFLDRFPEMSIMPVYPTATEMYEMFKEVIPEVDQRRFSVLFGAERAACSRWLRTGGTRVSPDLARLMLYLRNQLTALPPEDRLEAIKEWAEIVDLEGKARGVDNVFKVGRWTPSNQVKPANDDPMDVQMAPSLIGKRAAAKKTPAAKKAASKKTPTKKDPARK